MLVMLPLALVNTVVAGLVPTLNGRNLVAAGGVGEGRSDSTYFQGLEVARLVIGPDVVAVVAAGRVHAVKHVVAQRLVVGGMHRVGDRGQVVGPVILVIEVHQVDAAAGRVRDFRHAVVEIELPRRGLVIAVGQRIKRPERFVRCKGNCMRRGGTGRTDGHLTDI